MNNCPNCLGTGRVPQRIKIMAHVYLYDIEGTLPKIKCLACHGTGARPEWMNDERRLGKRDNDFDYAAHQ